MSLRAPFARPGFTVELEAKGRAAPRLRAGQKLTELMPVAGPRQLAEGTWCREGGRLTSFTSYFVPGAAVRGSGSG